MNVTITRTAFDPGARVLAVSDIHGHPDWLRRVLVRANYRAGEDYLVIVGDLIEKGPDSLGAIREAMALSAASERVFVLMGNVDLWRVSGILDDSGASDGWLYRNVADFTRYWGSSLFTELCREVGISYDSLVDFSAARAEVARRFADELHFLASRPVILDTPTACFVHGGLPCPLAEIDSLTTRDAFDCLKYDAFLGDLARRGESRFPRPVVVGHWPVSLYRSDILSPEPYLDEAHNVIAIDGGCGLKRDGQLNCLILAPDGGVDWVAVDDLPTVTALDAQAPSANSISIGWGDNGVRRLDEPAPEGYAAVAHIRTGRRLLIPAGDIWEEDGESYCQDITDYILPVTAGDTLAVIKVMPDGLLAKRAGVVGWYRGRYA